MKRRSYSLERLSLLAVLIFGLACGKSLPSVSEKSKAQRKGDRDATAQSFLASVTAGTSVPARSDEVGWRILSEYGAVLVARGGATTPAYMIFPDSQAVDTWQATVKTMRTSLDGVWIELQTPAMTALMEARTEALAAGLNISPRGSDAGRRSYDETVHLWQSRVSPGLEHWVRDGQLTRDEAARIRTLSPGDQIPEILRLEKEGMYFSTDFTKSILYSVAAPGTSQHLSMLAFDVKENEDARVRSILSRHGWFQTVTSDTPHFTFLGVTDNQLPSLGLKRTTAASRVFWIPNLE